MQDFEIVPFDALSRRQYEELAAILVRAFAYVSAAWPDIESARDEVATFFTDPNRRGLAALAGDRVVGWIGAIRQSRHACELHPLAVDPEWQRRGCGRRLVEALEEMARRDGVITVWLGTNDDFGGTSLFGSDLYPDVLRRLATLEVTTGHPFAFYRRLGYTVVGVLPDVEGLGKHDILMAKRLT